jgi:hypothetical protein
MKVEKDMIELTILEASDKIEKYHKETKPWRDKKIVRKNQNWRSSAEEKETLGKP